MRTRGSSSSPFSLFAFQDIITSVIAIVVLTTMILALEIVNRVTQAPEDAKIITVADIHSAQEQVDLLTREINTLNDRIKAASPKSSLGISTRIPPRELQKQIKRLTLQLTALEKKDSSVKKNSLGPELPLNELNKLAENVKAAQDKIDFIQSNNVVIYSPDDKDKRTCLVIDLSSHKIDLFPITEGMASKTLSDSSRQRLINKLKQVLSSLAKDKTYFLLNVRPTASPDLYFEVLKLLQQNNYRVGVEFMSNDVLIVTQSNFDKGIGL